ncbi:MAG: hypothetical protein AUJ92_03875 [Armatimonadetes bacterium CG2_30_59_28]|nr:molybdopterin molybdotransferase MoeA [Armatimonadota bacterium]OIO97336.1 MAG: hypothetical protein AUJ92_03875 [Armatimonadetes bacterium CG2_30_59_28]PIU63003.1 MAG: molybdopterin molybdenumtransferase MoeA [Armatimonadetes bacterium CG07_land_8_20_14_0_80_59_28]PIX40435.1 MAG: molybdopterin molybdenumtransferase MoeA [Armatimonadetes bacterium CG_4_8_14_3_um_filter_58_9]PIY38043.1 MAG: molybdopterin molybdenumtransferase MoeA [Armatimonadetes bacterium CG_4_10_14_3_um_filter_59_10]PJB76
MLHPTEALDIILASVSQVGTEKVPLEESLGRTLADDVRAAEDLPPFDNSAMDGYAVRAADTAGASEEHPALLRVLEDLPAGGVPRCAVGAGEAVRIMTGAPVPAGADAVVMVEKTSRCNGQVAVQAPVQPGVNIRRCGEDVRRGDVCLQSGMVLRPAEIGVLASLGFATVPVARQPVVAVLSTGDELLAPEEALTPGKIRDSNSPALAAMVRRYGGVPRVDPRVPDTVTEVEAALRRVEGVDLYLTSGGVSVGDFDVVKEVLSRLGEIKFWRLAIKPGKPLVFGRLGGRPLFGLPGNPVSALVAFEQFVRPALLKMQGRRALRKAEVTAVINGYYKSRAGKVEFVRAHTTLRETVYHARICGPQGSGRLSTMSQANSLIVLPEDVTTVQAGDHVRTQMLDYPEVE